MGGKIFRVKYSKGSKSLSRLSVQMRHWVDTGEALRGAIAGEYFVKAQIVPAVEFIARDLEATITIDEVLETAGDPFWTSIQRWGGTFMPQSQVATISSPESIPLHPVEGPTSPEPQETQARNDVNWQAILDGFQLYRSIFAFAMDNVKTAEGLEKAIAEICQQEGTERGEILDRMDRALDILTSYAQGA
jgi:hypothetical protein